MCHIWQVEFRERNAVVAQRWAALSEDNRKEWAMKAEAACSAAIQVRETSRALILIPLRTFFS